MTGVTTIKAALSRAKEQMASLLAAGVAFYLFLSLVPTIIAGVSVFGLFLTPAKLQFYSERIIGLLPTDAAALVTSQLERLEASSTSSLGLTAVIGLLVALWGASSGIAQWMNAINQMHPETQPRSALKARVLAIGMTLGGGVLLAAVVALLAAGQWARNLLDLGGLGSTFVFVGRLALLALVLLVAMTLLLGLAPNNPVGRQWSHAGVPVATVGWVLATGAFSIWADTLGSYGATWGALAGVVVLLMWLWVGVWATLLAVCVQLEAGPAVRKVREPKTRKGRKTREAKAKSQKAPKAPKPPKAPKLKKVEAPKPSKPTQKVAETVGGPAGARLEEQLGLTNQNVNEGRRIRLGPPPPDGQRPPDLRRRPPRRARTPV